VFVEREGRRNCSLFESGRIFWYSLKKNILPMMLGKDAHDLEKLFHYVWVKDINYKIQGLAIVVLCIMGGDFCT
jgi:hypothetical protein